MRIDYLLIGILAAIFCGSAVAEDFHTFRPKNGQSPLEAKLVTYDFGSQTVTLASQDGAQLQIAIADFNDTDKKWIVRSLEKQFFRRGAKSPAEQEPASVPPLQKNSPPGKLTSFREIPWQSKLADAAKLAEGGNSSADDKPILWFRVLGDLRGLM